MHKSLEFQIGQLANAFSGRRPGELPSKTEVNPREHVNAITLSIVVSISACHADDPGSFPGNGAKNLVGYFFTPQIIKTFLIPTFPQVYGSLIVV